MEPYGPWIFLQSKWPLFLVVFVFIITIITVRVWAHKKKKKEE